MDHHQAQAVPRRLALRDAAQNTGEIPDPMPLEVSAAPAPLTLREEMRRFINEEISARANDVGQESFEEADDFDIDVDEESILTSQYTVRELRDPEGRPDDLEGEPTDADPPVDPAKPVGTPLGEEEPPPAAKEEDPRA